MKLFSTFLVYFFQYFNYFKKTGLKNYVLISTLVVLIASFRAFYKVYTLTGFSIISLFILIAPFFAFFLIDTEKDSKGSFAQNNLLFNVFIVIIVYLGYIYNSPINSLIILNFMPRAVIAPIIDKFFFKGSKNPGFPYDHNGFKDKRLLFRELSFPKNQGKLILAGSIIFVSTVGLATFNMYLHNKLGILTPLQESSELLSSLVASANFSLENHSITEATKARSLYEKQQAVFRGLKYQLANDLLKDMSPYNPARPIIHSRILSITDHSCDLQVKKEDKKLGLFDSLIYKLLGYVPDRK